VSPLQLTVVIPVRDERENLRPLWEELHRILEGIGRSYELILVDDASTDGSGALLDELGRQDSRLSVLHLEQPSGQTAALDAGFRFARGDVIVTLDADLQSDAADIPRMLESLGTLDAVVGYRVRRRDSRVRRILSCLANAMRNRVLGETIRDTGCPLKVFRRSSLLKIRLYDGMHRFLPALMEFEGFRVIQIAVGHRPRRWRHSKYGLCSRLLHPIADLWAVRWMKRRRLRYRIRGEEAVKETERNSLVG